RDFHYVKNRNYSTRVQVWVLPNKETPKNPRTSSVFLFFNFILQLYSLPLFGSRIFPFTHSSPSFSIPQIITIPLMGLSFLSPLQSVHFAFSFPGVRILTTSP